MTLEERQITILNMRAFGGGFERRLADVYEQCDSVNAAKLELAFPEVIGRFGPGGVFGAARPYVPAPRLRVVNSTKEV